MNNIDLATLMPILTAVLIFAIAAMLIVVTYKTKQAQSFNVKSFERLTQELKSDHESLKSELASVKETLDSINKMMKEIE